MPIKVPRYFEKIKKSVFAEDYELDRESICEIERLLQEWKTTTSWDKEARADAGQHAKREIEALAKTLDKLPDQWQKVYSNHYLQQNINDAYCGRVDIALPKDKNITKDPAIADLARCVDKLAALSGEFQRLKDATNAVKSMGVWNSLTFPQFQQGRPSDKATDKLIQKLDSLAGCLGHKDKNDFIRHALKFIGMKFAQQPALGVRTRKTLRNIRAKVVSRK